MSYAGLLPAAGGGVVAYRALARPRDPAEAIADLVADAVPDGAGVTVLAALDATPVYAKGFGESDRVAGTAATVDTVYDIGSLTKQFTAAAIMTLRMCGELATTDRLGRFFPRMPADKADITVDQLLTHTAGLVDVLGGDYEQLSRAGLQAAGRGSELLSAPGRTHRYSNAGYSVLAALTIEDDRHGRARHTSTEGG